MGLFSRSGPGNSPRYLTLTWTDLQRLGALAFGGESIHPPGITGIPIAELDGPALAFHTAAGTPPAYGEFLAELLDEADRGGDWAYVGAFCVGWNTLDDPHKEEPTYLKILDRTLEVMRTDGVAYTSVPTFAIERWTNIHGYEEVRPAGWPSPVTYIQIPSPAEAPSVDELSPGELRKLAQAPAEPANMICAEGRSDGTVQAVIEGADPDSGQPRRWDWQGLTTPDYPSFLRELGDRLITHTYWAHDDVLPYLPCRARSRDELRIEARDWQP